MILRLALAAAGRGGAAYGIDGDRPGKRFMGYGVNPSAGTFRLLRDYPEPHRSVRPAAP